MTYNFRFFSENLLDEHFERSNRRTQHTNSVGDLNNNRPHVVLLRNEVNEIPVSNDRLIGHSTSEQAKLHDDIADTITKGCLCSKHCLENISNPDIREHIFSLREMCLSENDCYIMEALKVHDSATTSACTGKRKRITYTVKPAIAVTLI